MKWEKFEGKSKMNVVWRMAELAKRMHDRDTPPRKAPDGRPYIVHPMAVVEMLRSWGYTESEDAVTLAIAWGHDLLEDTRVAADEILAAGGELGPSILAGIRRLTFSPQDGLDKVAYDAAKAAYIEDVAHTAHPEVLVVKIADRLCNTLDFLAGRGPEKARSYLVKGEPLFNRLDVLKHAEAVKASCQDVRSRLDAGE